MIPLIVLIVVVIVIVRLRGRPLQRAGPARLRIDEAFAQIEVQLKRRHDLIPNLVNAVKGYMGFEQKVLTDVTNARAAAVAAGAQGPAAQAQAENALTGTLRSLFAVVENYPELKANQNVLELQEQLTTTENQIAFSRQHYNATRPRLQHRDPGRSRAILIAGMFGFTKREFFDAEPEAPDAGRDLRSVGPGRRLHRPRPAARPDRRSRPRRPPDAPRLPAEPRNPWPRPSTARSRRTSRNSFLLTLVVVVLFARARLRDRLRDRRATCRARSSSMVIAARRRRAAVGRLVLRRRLARARRRRARRRSTRRRRRSS